MLFAIILLRSLDLFRHLQAKGTLLTENLMFEPALILLELVTEGPHCFMFFYRER